MQIRVGPKYTQYDAGLEDGIERILKFLKNF